MTPEERFERVCVEHERRLASNRAWARFRIVLLMMAVFSPYIFAALYSLWRAVR